MEKRPGIGPSVRRVWSSLVQTNGSKIPFNSVVTSCPRNSYPLYILTYYLKGVTTSWTDGNKLFLFWFRSYELIFWRFGFSFIFSGNESLFVILKSDPNLCLYNANFGSPVCKADKVDGFKHVETARNQKQVTPVGYSEIPWLPWMVCH